MSAVTRFIGRSAAMASLKALFERGDRLATLLGPAGIGKTRLALELASSEPSAHVVELADVRARDALLDALERSLGVSGEGDDRIAAVGRVLVAREISVVVLDNAEQVIADVAEVVAAWLLSSPQLRIIVTSRETLRVQGEAVFEVPPLPEAAELFIDRARSAQPGFEVDDATRPVIEAIVQRLDRMPLAIELAAARSRVLSPEAILARLDRHLEILAGAPRDRTARQATMQGAIAWSWDLLDTDERVALRRLAVFRGGFDVDAAEAVCAGVATSVVDLLGALRDKSLLRFDGGRFGMYGVIQAYASTRTDGDDDLGAVETRHAEYFLGAGCGEVDRDNLAAILERFAEAEPALALGAAIELDRLSSGDGLTSNQAELLDRALRRVDDGAPNAPDPSVPESSVPGPACEARVGQGPAALGPALLVRAVVSNNTGRQASSRADCDRAIEIATVSDDIALAAAAHTRLGYVRFASGDNEAALASYAAALRSHRAIGDREGEALALRNEGSVLQTIGRTDEALERFERSRGLARAHGAVHIELAAEVGLGYHYLEAGLLEPTERHYRRALELAAEVGATRMAMLVTGYRGLACFDHGRLQDAAEHLVAAVAGARERGDPRVEGAFVALLGAVEAVQGDIDAGRRAANVAAGLLANHAVQRHVAELYAARVDVADSEVAAQAGDVAGWRRLREAAKACVARMKTVELPGGPLFEQSDDARVARRIVERALAEGVHAAGDIGRNTDMSGAGDAELVVARDGSWFELGDAGRVDLARRRVLKPILAAICAARETDAPVSARDLVAVGWPGERVARSAALNRLHVALATLRGLGLRQVIERRPEGYRLAPGIRLIRPAELT